MVHLNADRLENSIVSHGRLFHILTTRSAKNVDVQGGTTVMVFQYFIRVSMRNTSESEINKYTSLCSHAYAYMLVAQVQMRVA